ncbi:MAG: TlpA family protein disulfide reductase [Coriobacteriia bacterium]|nr:TlpA family protein disulfide reductase [Coriobacteriia bacterium]
MNKKAIVIIALVALVVSIALASLAYSILTSSGEVGGTPGSLITGGAGQGNSMSGQAAEANSNDAAAEGEDSASSGTANVSGQADALSSSAAPDIQILDSEGNAVRLSDFSGTPVVLNFWASWCPPCVHEMPDFERVYQELGAEVQFIMLNATDGQRETVATASQFISAEGFNFPVFFDTEGEAALAYNITAIPETLFIDREGNIVANHIGAMSEQQLRSALELIM